MSDRDPAGDEPGTTCESCGDPSATVNTPWDTKVCLECFGVFRELDMMREEKSREQ